MGIFRSIKIFCFLGNYTLKSSPLVVFLESHFANPIMSAFLSYFSDKSWLGIEMVVIYIYFVSLSNLKTKMNFKGLFYMPFTRPGNDHPWKWQFYDLESPVIKLLKFESGFLGYSTPTYPIVGVVCFSYLLLLCLFWSFNTCWWWYPGRGRGRKRWPSKITLLAGVVKQHDEEASNK